MGGTFSLWQTNDAPMTQRALILTQQTKWLKGRHVCHPCDARARTRSPHKCRVPPRSVPPVKWCPTGQTLDWVVSAVFCSVVVCSWMIFGARHAETRCKGWLTFKIQLSTFTSFFLIPEEKVKANMSHVPQKRRKKLSTGPDQRNLHIMSDWIHIHFQSWKGDICLTAHSCGVSNWATSGGF